MDKVICGAHLSELLSRSREGFVHDLEKRALSGEYLRQAGGIIEGFIVFCRQHQAGQPWQLRRQFLHTRQRERRGRGYGLVLTHRARIVTRRHLHWLERSGLLAEGTAAEGTRWIVSRHPSATTSRGDAGDSRALLAQLIAKVDAAALPPDLRQPLVVHLEELVLDRGLAARRVQQVLHTSLALCLLLVQRGVRSLAGLEVEHLDEVACHLVTAPLDDLLRRRQQLRRRHGDLRGFLRSMHRQGVLERDLATALVSPPCYRNSTPPGVLSERQLETLLDSVDRGVARGRRDHAILALMCSYGLRPIDVARLRLEDLDWRTGRISLLQSKTLQPLTLPLMPAVATALVAYLRADRPSTRPDRQVFLSLDWPHQPLAPSYVGQLVKTSLVVAGLGRASARQLRASVATHLLRQGEALSTIQEVLGHRTLETTLRYAKVDVELLRQVLEEPER